MRRRLAVAAVASLVALALAGTALGGNGGVAPPSPHSPNAHRIEDSYWLILGLTGGIFALVEGALVVFVVRYRNRGRDRTAEGPQVRGHARLEIIWTVVPVLIITAIVTFVLVKLPGIKDVPKARAGSSNLNIKIDAHQFYWQFTYPDGTVSIDELHVPINRVVTLDIRSRDVDHSWWIPEFDGKFDAIPGRTNHTWFKADTTGTFRGQCGEFCGLFHAAMQARVFSESQAAYQSWLSGPAKTGLGKGEFTGVCAKCHGPAGKGAYGPDITSNPILSDFATLKQLVLNGKGRMPPVSAGWNDRQLHALFDYVRKNVYAGGSATTGTTSGG